jgi:uncharacterized membrane protein YgdD (TMEM256/DUF423 family)
MLKNNHWAALGALSCGLTVAIGAFGAHGLEDHFERVPRHGEIYQTAVLYQMFHSLALLIYAKAPAAFGVGCARAFSIGIVLFSGSLYGIVFTGINALGMITPIGGSCFLLGWLLLSLELFRTQNSSE